MTCPFGCDDPFNEGSLLQHIKKCHYASTIVIQRGGDHAAL